MSLSTGRAHRIITIADDLTGACDAAIYFADAGLATFVSLHFDDVAPAGCESWALNTNTRCADPPEARARARHAFERAQALQPEKMVKKIDSMMRGNIAVEIAMGKAVLEPQLIVLTPAFPALGRTVREGNLSIEGGEPLSIVDQLAGLRCAVLPSHPGQDLAENLEHAVYDGVDVVIPDTSSDDDLQRLVEAGSQMNDLLWAGSGGLTRAIASTMNVGRVRPPSPLVTERSLLFCVGSDHGATLAQLRHLETCEHAAFAQADPSGYETIDRALQAKRNVVLLLERKQLCPEALLEFVESLAIDLCGGLILTGGDTALAILEALGAYSIHSHAEVLPGIPQGRIVGGVADGLPVVTKSGAFGRPDVLSRCVQMLRSSTENKEVPAKEAIL